MAKHVWTMCCENAIVDARTNNVTLISLVEQLNVPARAPFIAVRLVIGSLWEREAAGPDAFKCRFSWQGPQEHQSSSVADFKGEIEGDKRRSRVFVEVHRLDFRGQGNYHLVTELQDAEGAWNPLSTYRVEVVQLPD